VRPLRLSAAVGAGFVVWGGAAGLLRLHDNSFLTHVATGHLIVSHGVPHTDPYSFTALGHPWVVESWLASFLYGEVDRSGAHGLQFLHAALAATLAGLVWILTRPAGTLAGRIVVATAALSIGTGYWSPRPLLIGLVLFAVVILLAEQQRGSPWVLLPIMWVWVNVHGSWVLGLAYLVLRLIGRAVGRVDLGRLPRLIGATVVGIALGAVNPFGVQLLTYPLRVATDHQAFAHIAEWESPSFSDITNLVLLATVLVTLVLLVARRGFIEDALVVTVFFAMACLASRNVPVASLAVTPIFARGLTGLGSLDGARRGVLPSTLVALWAGLAALSASQALRSPEFDLAAYPVAAVTAMQERGLAPGRVATQDFVGNYLEFRYGSRASAFIDDRVDMYPKPVESAYGTLLAGSSEWEAVLDGYRVHAVLWAKQEPLAGLLAASPRWQIVWQDSRWVVAVRRPVAPLGQNTSGNALPASAMPPAGA
jgi:hypothetical protein